MSSERRYLFLLDDKFGGDGVHTLGFPEDYFFSFDEQPASRPNLQPSFSGYQFGVLTIDFQNLLKQANVLVRRTFNVDSFEFVFGDELSQDHKLFFLDSFNFVEM